MGTPPLSSRISGPAALERAKRFPASGARLHGAARHHIELRDAAKTVPSQATRGAREQRLSVPADARVARLVPAHPGTFFRRGRLMPDGNRGEGAAGKRGVVGPHPAARARPAIRCGRRKGRAAGSPWPRRPSWLVAAHRDRRRSWRLPAAARSWATPEAPTWQYRVLGPGTRADRRGPGGLRRTRSSCQSLRGHAQRRC
jgi:hypothetical protein